MSVGSLTIEGVYVFVGCVIMPICGNGDGRMEQSQGTQRHDAKRQRGHTPEDMCSMVF